MVFVRNSYVFHSHRKARLEVQTGGPTGGPTGGKIQKREVRTASSYESQNALTVHFGLGEAKQVDRLTVRWLDGKVFTLPELIAFEKQERAQLGRLFHWPAGRP